MHKLQDSNKACPRDYYPLQRIYQLVDSTSKWKLLSIMDVYQGYHQIKIDPKDILKAAFGVCCGTYGYANIPFGLKNVGVTYQCMMDKIFKRQIGRNIEVYIDSMLVKSLKSHTHTTYLNEVFAVVKSYGLKLNPTKCAFGVQSRKYLGYVVTPKGIEVNQAKLKAIQEMVAPRSIKEIQKLNGRITT